MTDYGAAITVARNHDKFAGIRPADVQGLILGQIAGTAAATMFFAGSYHRCVAKQRTWVHPEVIDVMCGVGIDLSSVRPTASHDAHWRFARSI